MTLDLPESDRIRPRPVLRWETSRMQGRHRTIPPDEVVRDAIEVLREGADDPDDPKRDYVYAAAERILVRDFAEWS